MNKVSMRFFDDKETKAVWNDGKPKWCLSAFDIIGILRGVDDYEKNQNCWKYFKTKLKRDNN